MMMYATLGLALLLATADSSSVGSAGSIAGGEGAARRLRHQSVANGLRARSPRDELKAMLVKYTARCALAADQFLEATEPDSGGKVRFPGAMGLAPEWLNGTCDTSCQEKVSACLLSLSNRTGRHVQLSLLSAAPSMNEALRPNDGDAGFPHQEGVFFGNVFGNVFGEQGFACTGTGASKAAQVKRFCAADPESCAGLVPMRSAGRCEDVCEMACTALSDGSRRCAAVSCRDPEGRVWNQPLTVYLRNKIEAANADDVTGLQRHDDGLDKLDRGDSARFERIDFGTAGTTKATLSLEVAVRHAGRLEAWVDGERRLATFEVAPSRGDARVETASIQVQGLTGVHSVVLKVVAGRDIGRLSTLELR
jgi:hypothetical protein